MGNDLLREEAVAQALAAHDAIEEHDPATWVRYPWAGLDALVGAMSPGELHTVLALSGNGKTTLLVNLLHEWLMRKTRCYVLGFETDPKLLRLMLAGCYLKVDPRLVARLAWDQLPEGTQDQVETHLLMQTEAWHTDLLHLDGSTYVGPRELDQIMRTAHKAGYQVLLVDHFDRFDARSYQDTKLLAEGLKEGAKAYNLAVLCANQVSRVTRGTPAFRRTTPPSLDDSKGGNVLGENSDAILSLFRPLVAEMTKADRAMVTAGLRPVEDFIDHRRMGVKIEKSRWTSHAGQTTYLTYTQGLLTDPATEAEDAVASRYGL